MHFAVALDMYDETVYLLESGANYLIINKEVKYMLDAMSLNNVSYATHRECPLEILRWNLGTN